MLPEVAPPNRLLPPPADVLAGFAPPNMLLPPLVAPPKSVDGPLDELGAAAGVFDCPLVAVLLAPPKRLPADGAALEDGVCAPLP